MRPFSTSFFLVWLSVRLDFTLPKVDVLIARARESSR